MAGRLRDSVQKGVACRHGRAALDAVSCHTWGQGPEGLTGFVTLLRSSAMVKHFLRLWWFLPRNVLFLNKSV